LAGSENEPAEDRAWDALFQCLAVEPTRPKRVLVVGGGNQALAAARRHDLEAIALSVADLSSAPEGAPFDGCIMDRSLEKVRDPGAALAQVHALLTEDGLLCVCAASEFAESDDFCFDVDTLQNLLIKSGFTDPIAYMKAPVPSRERHLLMRVRRRREVQEPKLSIVIPVYNERKTFSELIRRVMAEDIAGVEREIIIVESNSTDGSREEVLKYRDHPNVRVILEDTPRGKGHAVRTALHVVTGSIVLFQDADLEYDVSDYSALIKPILDYRRNFVLGSRHNFAGDSWKMRSFTNAPILSVFFNVGHVLFQTMLNVLYHQALKDPFTMFKVFRTECLYGLTFECNRFDFDFEIVIKLVRKGYRPLELPVNYRSRSLKEGKKVTVLRDPMTWLRALWKFRKSPLYE
jgi:hypothetical protein